VAERDTGFWILQGPGWALLLYLGYAQAIPAFSYELGIAMGTQESAAQITEVGTAFWYGFAFGDAAIYMPTLLAGLIGCWKGRHWGRVLMGAALGITVYWPVVSLAAIVAARESSGWHLKDETAYWIVLPLITLWAVWGLWHLSRLGNISSASPRR
jgi:hypothetical protein